MINSRVVEHLNLAPDTIREYNSTDSIVEHACQHLYPPEFLNSLRLSGLPPHNLRLAIGLPIMLLRNMDAANGHVNGARYIITGLSPRIIEAVAVGNKLHRVFIPRMKLHSSDKNLPFTLQRIMFPVRLSFAMTINKSQGQSLDLVGMYLPEPVFAHASDTVGSRLQMGSKS